MSGGHCPGGGGCLGSGPTSATGVVVDGSFEREGRRYVLYAFGLLMALGFATVAWVSFQRLGQDPAPSVPVVVQSAVEVSEEATEEGAPPTESPSPSEAPTIEATPSPTETESERVGTVLFEGGPAMGPWQQLGTVAEITHPGAPSSARVSYLNGWSDPDDENQPDDLWDQLVVEVTDQLVALGEPVDRPVFGGAAGSEAFNAAGGMEDVYVDDRVFSAYWAGSFEDAQGVGRAYFHYLIGFDGEVVDRNGPIVYREDGSRTFEENAAEHVAALRDWAAEGGFAACVRC